MSELEDLLRDPTIRGYLENNSLIDHYVSLFKAGDFSFIVEGIASNSEGDFVKGQKAKHKKQEEALKILTSNKFDFFLYGGAAGGAKSFTGMTWILFSALAYKNTRYFIARNEIKDIRDSVIVTFKEVCDHFSVTDYHYNSVQNVITLPNKSQINLIEVKYKPSDPDYKDVGSTLYTSGWFEEVGEINQKAVNVLQTRVNRWGVDEHGLSGIVFMTGNPANNWTKQEYYKKEKNGELEKQNNDPDDFNRKFLSCLVTENPFMTEKYIRNLRNQAKNDKAIYERLFKGNWDYDDNPYQLANQEDIENIFSNDHVEEGTTYITCDVARYGEDKAVIMVWKGWVLVEIREYAISATTEIAGDIKMFMYKYKVPKTRCVADADGVGGGVIDMTGIKSFKNGGSPIKINRETPNYKNIQVQCLYYLAEKINNGEIWVKARLGLKNPKEKEDIIQDLSQIQYVPNPRAESKLDCKNKGDIKKDIGRSPDYRDAMLMRCWFDLKPQRRMLIRRIPK